MYRILIRRRFLYAVLAAAMCAEQLDPIEREHMGMNVDDWHCDLTALDVALRCTKHLRLAEQQQN
jgi:hypothetical protein